MFLATLCTGEPSFVIDEGRFLPGPHTLDVTITTDFGQTLAIPPITFVIEG